MSQKVTVSVIKADVGSVAGHTKPHPKMMKKCEEILKEGVRSGTINDFYVTRVGDDINLFMTHYKGENNKDVHALAWTAFQAASKLAKDMKMYAAGQDILSDAFSGNIRGMGPGAAEVEFVERGAEPMVFFMADKTEPSAYSMPISRVFMDPFTTTGLVIDPRAHEGFRFEIVDVMDSKRIVMSAPEKRVRLLKPLASLRIVSMSKNQYSTK
ncbi:MAG: fructose-1,6-bisphosphatase, partial [Methanomassiliicoccales archaeon]|nr:fructose-1,6-bisphosphatase [Methanomassiliicoccales archaeon]